MMKYLSSITSIFSAATILDRLGLETKRTAQARALTYTGLVLGGVAVGAVAALLLAPKSGRELRSDVVTRSRQLSSRMANKKDAETYGARSGTRDVSNVSNVSAVGAPEGVTGI